MYGGRAFSPARTHALSQRRPRLRTMASVLYSSRRGGSCLWELRAHLLTWIDAAGSGLSGASRADGPPSTPDDGVTRFVK